VKLVIAGTRYFDNYDLLKEEIDKFCNFNNVEEIISGGSAGADTLAHKYALENNIRPNIFNADWKNLGRSAGPIRNTKMAENGDVLIVFWDGISRGTKNMMDQMKNRGKPVFCIKYDS